MKKILTIGILFCLTASVDAVTYHFFNGEKLLEAAQEWEKYQKSPNEADTNIVAGYAGYVGAIFDQEARGLVSICVEEGTTKNDILKAVSKYVTKVNRKIDRIATDIVKDALFYEYACS